MSEICDGDAYEALLADCVSHSTCALQVHGSGDVCDAKIRDVPNDVDDDDSVSSATRSSEFHLAQASCPSDNSITAVNPNVDCLFAMCGRWTPMSGSHGRPEPCVR